METSVNFIKTLISVLTRGLYVFHTGFFRMSQQSSYGDSKEKLRGIPNWTHAMTNTSSIVVLATLLITFHDRLAGFLQGDPEGDIMKF